MAIPAGLEEEDGTGVVELRDGAGSGLLDATRSACFLYPMPASAGPLFIISRH